MISLNNITFLAVGIIHFIPNQVPMLGETGYSLTCKVALGKNLFTSMSYRWTKNISNGTAMQLGATSNTLFFPSLRVSDSGLYTCFATISSRFLSTNVTLIGTHNVMIQSELSLLKDQLRIRIIIFHNTQTLLQYFNIIILLLHAVPAPTSVMLSSSASNPVRPIGSTILMTCTVHAELSIALDDSVIVKTVLSGPAGFTAITNTSQPILGGSHIFTSTAMIRSFGQAQSGVYSCAATVHSHTAYSNTTSSSAIIFDYTRITTGKIAIHS